MRKHLASLDGLRGVAALAVVGYVMAKAAALIGARTKRAGAA